MSMCYLLRVWKSLTVIFCPERPPFRLENIRHWHGFNIRAAIRAIYKRHISSKIRRDLAKTRFILEQPLTATLVLRYLHKTRTQRMHALIFGGKIIACPVHWQATGGKNCLQITTRFRFLAYSALFFIRSNTMSTSLLKVKRNQAWTIAEEKDFLLLCKEKAMTDLLDKCVTSAGVSSPF